MVAGARQSLPWKKKAERTKEQERRNRIRRWWPPHWNGAVRGWLWKVLEYMLENKSAWTGGELGVGVLKGEENTNMFNL